MKDKDLMMERLKLKDFSLKTKEEILNAVEEHNDFIKDATKLLAQVCDDFDTLLVCDKEIPLCHILDFIKTIQKYLSPIFCDARSFYIYKKLGERERTPFIQAYLNIAYYIAKQDSVLDDEDVQKKIIEDLAEARDMFIFENSFFDSKKHPESFQCLEINSYECFVDGKLTSLLNTDKLKELIKKDKEKIYGKG